MSAGDVIVQLRELVRISIPYLQHAGVCAARAGRECTCGLDALKDSLRRAADTDAGRTGGPSRRPLRAPVLILALLAAGASSSCATAHPSGGTVVYVRPDTVKLPPVQLPPDTLPRQVVRLAPDTLRPAPVVLPADTVKPAPVQLPPDTLPRQVVQLPPDTLPRQVVQLAPDTLRPAPVVLPADTVKPAPVRLPPDTLHPVLVVPVDTLPHTIPAGAGVAEVQADTTGLHVYDWPSRVGENNVYHGTTYLGRIAQDGSGAWVVYRYIVSDADPVVLRRDCEAYASRYIAMVMLDTPPNALSWRTDQRGRVLDTARGCTLAP